MEIFKFEPFPKKIISPYQTPKLDAESGSSLQSIAVLLASATLVLEWLILNPRTLQPGVKSDSNAIGNNLEMQEKVVRSFLIVP